MLLIILFSLFYKDLWVKKIAAGLSLLVIILFSIPVYASFIHSQGTGARLSMVTIFSEPRLQQLSAEGVVNARKNNDLIKEILYNRRVVFAVSIIGGYFDHFDFDFLFLHGDGGVQHHAYNMGMLYLWEFPFILIGLIYLLKKRNKRILVLLALFFIAPLPASITTGTPHPVRAIAMIPAFHVFTAVGFVLTSLFLLKKQKLGKAVFTGIIVLFIINFSYYLYSYYVQTPIKYGYFWQYGNKEAVLYAKEQEEKYDHIIMTYKYDQPYVYYLFYNKIDPSWYQKNWNYSGTGKIDRFYRKIGKYEFTDITSYHLKLRKTLLIGTQSEINAGTGKLKQKIYFPDGNLAYKIVEL